MASFFDQAPLYDNSRSTGSIRDLLLMQGEQKAQAARQAGDNWARTIGGIGNAVAGGVAAYGEHKAEQKQQAQMQARDAAGLEVAQRWDGKDPMELHTALTKIGGPEYADKYGKTVMAFHSKPSEDAKDELGNFHTAAAAIPQLPEAMRPAAYQALVGRFGKMATEKLGFAPQMLEGDYTPEHEQALGVITGVIGERLGIKPKEAPKPIEVSKGASLVDASGKVLYAPTPEAPKLEHVDLGNKVVYTDAQGNVVKEMTKGAAPKAPGEGGGGSDDTAQSIADAIMRGEQPPDMKALYKYGAPVKAILAKNGYNLAGAATDWAATQKHLATANSATQVRMYQAIDNASHSLDVIDDLAGKWAGGKFPALNRAQIKAAKSGILGPDAQAIATQLDAQIADVTSELGNVYMGGNSPTDHSLGLAKENLSSDWSEATLKSMTALARKNLQIRSNSMKNTGVIGASANNPYAAPAAAPAAPSAPAGLPRAGSKAEYDAIPAGAMYVGSDGQVRKKGS